jgi:hypothetical protein
MGVSMDNTSRIGQLDTSGLNNPFEIKVNGSTNSGTWTINPDSLGRRRRRIDGDGPDGDGSGNGSDGTQNKGKGVSPELLGGMRVFIDNLFNTRNTE